jgi:1,4-alpha-glucan branching enzyme
MTTIREDGTVEFVFYRPQVREVRIAGDFSSWLDRAVQMKPRGDGWWSTQLNLPAGEYRFRYVADNSWFTDYASHGIETCETGWNSVLLIPEKPNLSIACDLERSGAYECESVNKTRVKSAA